MGCQVEYVFGSTIERVQIRVNYEAWNFQS
jgi:hypothetical protein